ncbi:histone acetyltransferase subunit NuA4-domain-containing protein [Xylariaceae sp. FL0804]|nr:histone acetyltransferase subunit NuA4-domain-containing protein [Xylariaceae sp. FL0804]
MAENVQPAPNAGGGGANGDQAGVAHYDKQRQYLRELLHNRKALEKQLQLQEQNILQKETEYLESTPYGNIITGFDGYIKGSSSAAAQRKRTGQLDQNRVFSRSSLSYNQLHVRLLVCWLACLLACRCIPSDAGDLAVVAAAYLGLPAPTKRVLTSCVSVRV